MEIRGIAVDRKMTVAALEKLLGTKAHYLGAPTFAYQVGNYKVLREGALAVDDEDADPDIIRSMIAQDLLDPSWDQPEKALHISLPMDGHSGRSLCNLVAVLYSKGVMMSKACGRPGAFRIQDKLARELKKRRPETIEEFLQIFQQEGTDSKGVQFADGKIIFEGYPLTTDQTLREAYMVLSEKICQVAIDQKWVNFQRSKSDNDKYSFRNFLIRIGLNGPAYKKERKVLLKNLKGHVAFRTEEQRLAAAKKVKEYRQKREEENTFHLL